jgi:hypothetical protein
MKHLCNKALIIALLAFVSFFSASNSFAQPSVTSQNSSISNSAQLTFDVGAVTGQTLNSSPTGNGDTTAAGEATVFLVDRLIDLSITQTATASPIGISAGGNDYVLEFTLVNESNSNMDFVLDATANTSLSVTLADAGTGLTPPGGNQFEATVTAIYGDGGNDTFEGGGSGDDTLNRLKDVSEDIGNSDNSRKIYVVVSVPAAQVLTDYSYISVTARAALTDADSNGSTDVAALINDDNGRLSSNGSISVPDNVPDAADEVQNVFSDGPSEVVYNGSVIADGSTIAQNGQFSSTRLLTVDSALILAKTSLVIWDNLNGFDNPKALPGAFVQYTLTITNQGTQVYDLGEIVDTITTSPANSAVIDDKLLGTSCTTPTTTVDGVVTFVSPGSAVIGTCDNLNGTDYGSLGATDLVIKISYDLGGNGSTINDAFFGISSTGVSSTGSTLTVDLDDDTDVFLDSNFPDLATSGQLAGGDVLTITFNAIVE